ncbi:hypothetical protein [Spirosoma lituiforme]
MYTINRLGNQSPKPADLWMVVPGNGRSTTRYKEYAQLNRQWYMYKSLPERV